MTEQTPPKYESNKLQRVSMQKIDLKSSSKYHTFFSGLTQYGQYHGCGWAVDKGIGASRYNAGIMSAMASQITSLTIVC